MVIGCPYAGEPDPRTVSSLAEYGVAYVDVSHHSASYPSLLGRLWGTCESLVIVEHDIVVPPGTIEAFKMCPEDWCYHKYAGIQSWGWPALGLVRVRGDAMEIAAKCWEKYLQRRPLGGFLNPDTLQPQPVEEIDADEHKHLPPWNSDPQWLHCDEWMAAYLRYEGFIEHQHYPDCLNLGGRNTLQIPEWPVL